MFRAAPWEVDAAAPVAPGAVADHVGPFHRFPWDSGSSGSDTEGDDGFSASQSSDEDEVGHERSPSDDFINEMVSLYLERDLNARQFCTLMYLLGRCGTDIQAKARELGVKPGSSSGNYEKHCKKMLGGYFDETASAYTVRMPGRKKNSLGRAPHLLNVSAVHEELDADIRAEPGFRVKLEEAVEERAFPPIYYSHPAVVEHGGEAPVLPLNLFVDGVPYSQCDSIIGFWLINCLSGRRYFFCGLRKKLLCDCGCRGWCSFFAVFQFISWMLTALVSKRMPLQRHDNKPWTPQDTDRAQRAGQPLAVRCILMFVKGDWAEYATTLGFPSWADTVRPCFACNAAPQTLQATLKMDQRPWRQNAEEDYFVACDRCELVVVVPDQTMFVSLRACMRYDKRKGGVRGLSLKEDFPALQLRIGDRLDPTGNLPDVGDFFDLASFPTELVFWRTSRESLSRHRNPLFNTMTGVTPFRCLTIDVLHALYLGIVKTFACHALWHLLRSGVFGSLGSGEEQLESARLALNHKLFQWYKKRHLDHPGEALTRVSDLTRKMIGQPTKPVLKTKAAESWGMLLFVVDTARTCQHRLGSEAERLVDGGRCLIDLVGVFDSHGATLPAPAIARCFDLYARFLDITAEWEDMHIPKRHVFGHAIERLSDQGNPKLFANWHDESLNKLLKGACRQISQVTFETSLLQRMRVLLSVRKRMRA